MCTPCTVPVPDGPAGPSVAGRLAGRLAGGLRALAVTLAVAATARATATRGVLGRGWRALCAGLPRLTRRSGAPPGVCVAVNVSDRARARALEREVVRALVRLRRCRGVARLAELEVFVQEQIVVAGRQLAGCSYAERRPDGTAYALIRLALGAEGRRYGPDELLALLADQCFAVALEHGGGGGVLVPVEPIRSPSGPTPAPGPDPSTIPAILRRPAPAAPSPSLSWHPDPLAPRSAGADGVPAGAPAA